MKNETMTIHRALSELKLIDAKIEKSIESIEPTGLMQEGKLVNEFYQKEAFEGAAKSKLQSVNDLIERKNLIKSAIVKANGVTEIEVAGRKMTIADAINYKLIIGFKKNLIKSLTDKHNSVKKKFILHNEKVNTVALENAKIMIGKQGDDRVKATDADVMAIVEPYVKRNEFHLIDPLEIDKLIINLQADVDEFEAEVDATLSEINALTIIEI